MLFESFIEFCALNKIKYKLSEPLSEHTSFKIGGEADIFLNVCSKSELCLVLKELEKQNIPYFIIGKGSNLLVSDKGIEGAVISLSGMSKISAEGENLIADAGASLAAVCLKAAECGLSGLEFAYGIPGSVGGALFMNAGAYGGEMADAVISAEYVTTDGECGELTVEEMKLGYRTSVFKSDSKIITNVRFKLKSSEKEKVLAAMEDFLSRRKEKQPLEYPSAGSAFKRPEGYFAGALIEKNGLKGFSIGGAAVSEKHAGFVINKDGATCNDVLALLKSVQETVFAAEGVMLEPEVIFVGRK